MRQPWEEDEDWRPRRGHGSVPVEEVSVDVIVAGGGVAGLMAAYRAQLAGAAVLWLGGSGAASSRVSSINTALSYDADDTPAALFDDMFRAGGYINQPDVVAALAGRVGDEIRRLEKLGVPLHRDGDRLARRQAAGSTRPRAVFTLGMIGLDIARSLKGAIAASESPRVIEVKGGHLLELLVCGGEVAGALVYAARDDRWIRASAPAVVLATGGGGQLFGRTTNPRGSRGTGYAVALEAGAELIDMEFVSFEPFVTSAPEGARGHDLPTTVLREGARLRNGLGEEFIDTASAPTKDVICRAMLREVMQGRGTASGSLYYDVRSMDPEILARYVQIQAPLRQLRLSVHEGLLEVLPAQHYMMGGVRVNAQMATSVPGLYAVGEVSGGAHGAHRLAAGGGMEIVAGGAVAGDGSAEHALAAPRRHLERTALPRPELLGLHLSSFAQTRLDTIRSVMDRGCGILRQRDTLSEAVEVIEPIARETMRRPSEAFLLRSARTALAVASCALARAESRGDHFRSDHPVRDDRQWLGNLVVALNEQDEIETRYETATRSPETRSAVASRT